MNLSIIKQNHEALKKSWWVQSIYSDKTKTKRIDNWKNISIRKKIKWISEDDIKDIISQNKNAIVLKLMTDLPIINKDKKVPLKKFIKDYLNSLSLIEDSEFIWKLDYYIDLYEMYWLSKSELLNKEIVVDRNRFSKSDIMFELVFNNVLLPKYDNKKQFYWDMLKLLPRVESTINKFISQRSPIIIPPAVPRTILENLSSMQSYTVLKSEVIKWWLIKQIGMEFYLWEKKSINEANEFKFSFLINDESLLSRNQFIVYLEEILNLKTLDVWKQYFLNSDSNLNYSVYVWEEMFENESQTYDDFKNEWLKSSEDWYLYNWFEVSIYANSIKNLDTEEILSNICRKLPWITESFIKDIYETYWTYNWKNVWFPEKTLIFNTMNGLNVIYEWDTWEYLDEDTWDKLLQNAQWNSDTEAPFDIIDLDKRDRVKLLLDNKISLALNVFSDQINNPEKYKKLWVTDLPTWWIFYWPGWVWKSEYCYEIWYMTKNKSEFSKLDLSVLFNQFLWNSEKMVKKLFNSKRERFELTWRIQLIFIDEIDGLFSNDMPESLAWVRSVLLTELSDWDNKGLIFLWTTNYIEKLSWPISRRFSKKIWVDLPDKKTIKSLIKFNINKYKTGIIKLDKWDLNKLTDKFHWKSHDFVNKIFANTLVTYGYLNNKVVTIEDILSHYDITDDEIKNWKIDIRMWFNPN